MLPKRKNLLPAHQPRISTESSRFHPLVHFSAIYSTWLPNIEALRLSLSLFFWSPLAPLLF
jgi:hypothetical protein